jgi:uncharacterized membrane protein HdeD (DUF308 family)
MIAMTEQDAGRSPSREWIWTLTSGLFTILLAFVAFLLPELRWAPKGGLVGWLLLLAGIAEFAFGWKRGRDTASRTAVGSGAVTTLAGLLFVANPLADFYPVANVVSGWLLVRGAWVLAMALRVRRERLGVWLATSGAADILLGVLLLVGLPITALVVLIFGPTLEVVAQFALILAASFLITGLSQVAIGLDQRRRLP